VEHQETMPWLIAWGILSMGVRVLLVMGKQGLGDCLHMNTAVHDLFGNTVNDKLPGGKMCQRFIEPPFTTLDQRSGRWQDRKREWLALGLQGELGRSASPGGSMMPAADYSQGERGDGRGRHLGRTVSGSKCTSGKNTCMIEGEGASVSIFDPVLCELIYSWFMPDRPSLGILDPFAGGSVRGIVAGRLGYEYSGVELRPEQIEANVKQALEIPCDPRPHWVCGDSINIEQMAGDEYDLLFTCPPYWNLERYSDDPRDISTLDRWPEFAGKYQRIMYLSARRLKSQRFAVVVVGNIRDGEGFIRDMRGPTGVAMADAGFKLYNEFILLTPIGSLPLRVNGQFSKGRKAGAAHQYVLCFFRGNPEAIDADFHPFEK
jgi:hypothetical protein